VPSTMAAGAVSTFIGIAVITVLAPIIKDKQPQTSQRLEKVYNIK
jgi:sodium/pantothenate symporter